MINVAHTRVKLHVAKTNAKENQIGDAALLPTAPQVKVDKVVDVPVQEEKKAAPIAEHVDVSERINE